MAEVNASPYDGTKSVSETRTVGHSWQPLLRPGDKLASVDAVELQTDHLTITNVQVNSSDTVLRGKPVLSERAIMFTVAGGRANSRYRILMTGVSVDGETYKETYVLYVTADSSKD